MNSFLPNPINKIKISLASACLQLLAPVALCSLGLFLVSCSKKIEFERANYPTPADARVVDAEPGQYGGIFTLSLSQEPKTFNPLAITDAYSSQAVSFILLSLVDYDYFTQSYAPGLAKSWDISEDKLTFTFHLRKDLKWSDGHPFSADDVIFTFDTIFDPRYPNRYIDFFTVFDAPIEYKKIDDHTVSFTTKEPYAPFEFMIAVGNILPKHKLAPFVQNGTFMQQWSIQTAMETPEEIVGMGPFTLQSFKTGERMVLTPNPHYYKVDTQNQRLPYIDHLIFKFVSDTNTQTALFATGQTDATEISAANAAWVEKGKDIYGFTLYNAGIDSGTFFIWFNLHPGKDEEGNPFIDPYKLKWFSDKRFRQAVTHAMDRDGMVQAVYSGLGEPINTIISPSNKRFYNPHTPKYDYNPKKAKELLNQSGFKYNKNNELIDRYGNPVEFNFMVSEGSTRAEQIATIFVENLSEIGIKVNLQYIDFGSMIIKTSTTFDYEASMMGFTSSLDPAGSESVYKSSGRMHIWYPEQEKPATKWEKRIDELFEEQLGEFDFQKRVELVHEIQEIFSEELPLIFLINPYTYQGIKTRWKNAKIAPNGSLLHNLDEFWTENTGLIP